MATEISDSDLVQKDLPAEERKEAAVAKLERTFTPEVVQAFAEYQQAMVSQVLDGLMQQLPALFEAWLARQADGRIGFEGDGGVANISTEEAIRRIDNSRIPADSVEYDPDVDGNVDAEGTPLEQEGDDEE